jgi:multicomponent Na+:H+ antiporter subunit C
MLSLIYFTAVIIGASGLFIMLTNDNYIRKIIGLGIFQSSVLIFYIAIGKIAIGIAPISRCTEIATKCKNIYSSPLPQVLMLTAVVVGFATLSVGLALIYRIFRQYGSISEKTINEAE